MKKTALILGGLVGGKLLKIILSPKQYEKVVVLSRRKIELEDPKLVQVVTSYDHLKNYQTYFCVDDVFIFRPSLLLGERKEFRFREKMGEWAGKLVSFGLIGPLEKFCPIEADRVAKAMVFAANTKGTGAHIYESDEIFQMAEQYSIL
jgi:hypothetical protein